MTNKKRVRERKRKNEFRRYARCDMLKDIKRLNKTIIEMEKKMT